MKSVLAIAVLAFSLSPALAQEAQPSMTNADEVQWTDGPAALPGTQMAVLYGSPAEEGMFVIRVKFPANYRVPPHTHPVDEIVTVISGEFNIGMGEEFDEAQTTAFTAGALVAMAPETAHFVHTGEETVIQISTQGPWGLNVLNPEETAGVVQ
jgi:quercetin dioxygenase-like cupin family protein